MRKPRVKWFLFVLALLAVVIGIPVIINESYKANSGYMTMWGAADALAYYGTILGALVVWHGDFSALPWFIGYISRLKNLYYPFRRQCFRRSCMWS